MADAATGDVISGLVQVGGIIGAILGGAWLVVRGRIGEANPAISQTRAEATEVFVQETRANREALNAIKETLAKNSEIMLKSSENTSRLISVQENILELMKDAREDEKFALRSARLLEQMHKQQIDREDRERGHGRRQIE